MYRAIFQRFCIRHWRQEIVLGKGLLLRNCIYFNLKGVDTLVYDASISIPYIYVHTSGVGT